MISYRIVEGRKLRCGYTTGTCAAAAAKAATIMLLTNMSLEKVEISTPGGEKLSLRVEECTIKECEAACAVRKDAGDDTDATDGILIFAAAKRMPGRKGIELAAGIGIGIVTQPGLACSVGMPAINPIPRKMITEAVSQAAHAHSCEEGIQVTIFIPQGEEVAKKTFNSRLGILGGLSVLGTSGIVEPMSEEAMIKTMFAEMDVQKCKGNKDLLVFFGNYGQDFARDVLGLSIRDAVICSNFVGELLDYAVFKRFRSLFLVGHAGKLVKLAQGVMQTHSKYADCRLQTFALYALLAGADNQTAYSIMKAATTDAALGIIKEQGLEKQVTQSICEKIDYYMQQRVKGKLRTGALMFSNMHGQLGITIDSEKLLELQRQKTGGNI
ncbi:MAG: cobalamin biosynthesis protein CbiD [Acholeplasmataceae bacterium]|nr:cobalamin biosynthesis protein CbiD [Acholeplasmataceae bacterium]